MILEQFDIDLLAMATPVELDLIEKALRLEKALSSPLDFAEYVSPETTRHPHLDLLNNTVLALIEHRLYKSGIGVQAVKDEDNIWRDPETKEPAIRKLSISMPPRHGKSFLLSEHLPAWFISKWPDKRVILASYEADFAASWGLKARRIIEEHPEFGNELDPSSRSGAKWDLFKRLGGMQTAGAGGPITGKGGDVLVADDLIKNDEEVRSDTERNNKESWWHSTFKTREQPGGGTVIINVHTRWHEDDITGRLLASERDWYVVNLPALAFDDIDDEGFSVDIEQGSVRDPLGRRPGEALCPSFFSEVQLQELASSEAGKVWFSALFQGRPSIDDAGIFPRSEFRFYVRRGDVYELKTDTGTDLIPVSQCYRFITADLAASTKTSADFTVFSVWDAAPGNKLILVDRTRDRMESADHMDRLLAFVQKHNDPYRKWKVRFVGVEKATYGLTLIQNLQRKPGIIVRPLDADKDKISRALPAGQAIKNHQVFFPSEADWISEWTYELTKFPNAAKDDQVDTLSYAVLCWLDLPISVREPKHEPVTMQERVEAHVEKLTKKKVGRIRVATLGRW